MKADALEDVPAHMLSELERLIAIYQYLEDKKTAIRGLAGRLRGVCEDRAGPEGLNAWLIPRSR